MNDKPIFKYLTDLGCCNACSFRYMGFKSPNFYEDPLKCAAKFQENDTNSTNVPDSNSSEIQSDNIETKTVISDENSIKNEETNDDTEPPACKRRKWSICVSCIGVLQEETWPECFRQVEEALQKKRYACDTFACALSAPISTLLREKAIVLLLADKFPEYSPKNQPTPLKESWKWGFAGQLAKRIGKTLDSGAVSPLLITIHMEYPNDLEDLEPLKGLAPGLFSMRAEQRKRFTVDMTRRSVEQALEGCSLGGLRGACGWEGDTPPGAAAPVHCLSVVCAHAPLYLGGRYIKLSRELPQTPWVLNGERMMESSVQEIIFKPIEELYGITSEDAEHRLKFISAGREDVDVRCLGTGRPFAVEITDPIREPTDEDLSTICDGISKDGRIRVKNLQIVSKDDLTMLKQGEETKCKTYEALCVKLSHGICDDPSGPITVTQEDIDKINAFTNTKEGEEGRVHLLQKTPIRVLHRRTLLTRSRKILDLKASLVPGHKQLFHIKVQTSAGTYIKEWVHGELGRSVPALGAPLSARLDILALDVATVHLDWPNKQH